MSRSIALYMNQQNDLQYENYLMEGIIEDIKNKFKDIKFFNKFDQNIKDKQKIVQTKLKQHEDQLQKANIDVSQIKKIIQDRTPTIVRQLRNVKTAEEGGKILSNGFKEIFGITKEHVLFSEKVGVVSKGIILSLFLVILVIFINTFVLILFSILSGSMIIGYAIAAIFSAPLVEETAKFLAIKYNATGQFWIVFNTTEFLLYMKQAVLLGMPMAVMAIARTIAVMLHTITMYIMYKMRKEGERAGNIEEANSKVGLYAGMMIHFFWNLNAILRMI